MAKSPAPGRVKTRLCPPLSPVQAAAVAEAALADTLEAVAASGADRRVLALDGAPGPWLPPGFEVLPQRGNGLAERLAAAWDDAGGPGVQIGMDTPQVSPALLDGALSRLDAAAGRRLALLGAAADGGWWAIGLPHPVAGVFDGVPMSTPDTGAQQLARLRRLGWQVDDLAVLRDIDTISDLGAVAADLPGSRTEAVVADLGAIVPGPASASEPTAAGRLRLTTSAG